MPNWFRLSARRLRALRRLSLRERLLLAEAFAALGLARLAIIALPFRWIAARLDAAPADHVRSAFPTTRRVGTALHVAARVTPWRSKCLEQAIAGKLMLLRRGLPSTLHLGVAKEGDRMEAHAWLRCGNQIVTGGHELERFGVVARFGRPVSLRGAEQRSNPHLAHSGKAVLAQREPERQP